MMGFWDNSFSANNRPDYEEEIKNRIESWIKIRFLIAYLLFASIFLYRPSLNLPYPIAPLLGTLMLVVIFNSLSFLLMIYRRQWIYYLSYFQVVVDFIIITIVYQITGGIDSPFGWLYLYVILIAGLVGGLRFSVVLSFLSLGSLTFILWAQYHFLLPHFQVGNLATHSPTGFRNAMLIISEIISNGVMFFSLGLISGYTGNLAENRRLKVVEAYQLLKQQKEKALHAITAVQEDERKRIARELHDHTGQTLTVSISNLQVLETRMTSEPEVQKQLASLRKLTENLLDEVHDIIFDLRPSILDDLGVIPSLKWYLRNYIEPLGISVEVNIKGESRRLGEEKEIFLYRFLQEALSNVIKHSQASKVVIEFRFKAELLEIEVTDNGIGFETPTFEGGGDIKRWGLVGMKERIDLLQGQFQINSEPGKGTSLLASVPLKQES